MLLSHLFLANLKHGVPLSYRVDSCDSLRYVVCQTLAKPLTAEARRRVERPVWMSNGEAVLDKNGLTERQFPRPDCLEKPFVGPLLGININETDRQIGPSEISTALEPSKGPGATLSELFKADLSTTATEQRCIR
ncbi:unnamed protein product [Protopolystoma xenopodis]|uniref:Uncharacterized protein n=1 Tax=Protopolystoma xenopodis TaxID=117903 RepID=A0A448WWY3_9PLAT|nr:unnamed protein product [Protopolystoma xenopodis]